MVEHILFFGWPPPCDQANEALGNALAMQRVPCSSPKAKSEDACRTILPRKITVSNVTASRKPSCKAIGPSFNQATVEDSAHAIDSKCPRHLNPSASQDWLRPESLNNKACPQQAAATSFIFVRRVSACAKCINKKTLLPQDCRTRPRVVLKCATRRR